MKFETSSLVLETFPSVLLQKLLKDQTVLAPSDPLFLYKSKDWEKAMAASTTTGSKFQ